ncbi:DUF3877 family protein [Anaerocolumna sp. MB42-C2]|uniref:DUF3877 family protein n=1 Tax=Anaerocolumna sp. MB42-C2 TaxID=3070997 RepID=UPI0027DF4B34|nr:DUF3877 family protein [Anaerocolumna sp. MB42-C2]WMJ87320.1 DUF3877 family protein [Anaerocolumna sp. MB42-C2]
MSNKTGFFNLEENINSTIYEGLLKLGYQNNESFSIYYDLDLLNHLLQTAFESNELCLGYLQEFKAYAKKHLFDIEISLERNRFKFTVSKDGIEYIYKHENNPFLQELIQTVNTHSFHLEDILAIFKRYSGDYVCEEIDNDEFQYVLYFKNNRFDRFKYCFTFDEMGGYYHRLLDFSYNKIMNE